MAINAEFQQALSEKDVLMVRIMLKDSLILDPTFRGFNEMIRAAEASLPDLYAVHNGEVLNSDISTWTKSYMDRQMVQLIGNFSKERIEHLKVVCRYLYGAVAEKMEREQSGEKHKPLVTQKQVGTGMVIGGAAVAAVGAAVAVAGAATTHSAAIAVGTAVGTAVAIAGGVLIVRNK